MQAHGYEDDPLQAAGEAQKAMAWHFPVVWHFPPRKLRPPLLCRLLVIRFNAMRRAQTCKPQKNLPTVRVGVAQDTRRVSAQPESGYA